MEMVLFADLHTHLPSKSKIILQGHITSKFKNFPIKMVSFQEIVNGLLNHQLSP